MIAELNIRGLGVIAECELQFSSGMIAFTGETGAGKTLLVGALGLVLGDRADTGMVAGERADVSATVLVDPTGAACRRVTDAGGVVEPDGAVTVSRSVLASGRARAALGGAAVPVALVRELGDGIAQRHSQSDQLQLRSRKRQRQSLDAFGGPKLATALTHYQQDYQQYLAAVDRLAQLQRQRTEQESRLAELQEGLAEVADVRPKPGEETEVPQQILRLANAEQLAEGVSAALTVVAGAEDGALADLAAAQQSLARAARLDTDLTPLVERLGEAALLLDDIVSELNRYAGDLAPDPSALAELQRRKASLTKLQRDFGPTLTDVLAWEDRARAEVGELTNAADNEEAAQEEIAELLQRLEQRAAELSELREAAAERLSAAVTTELRELAMPDAMFRAEVTQQEAETGLGLPDGRTVAFGATGVDLVDFRLQPHPGGHWSPIGEGASGGELSRIMLALEVVLAESDPPAVFVFDEVDSGIGGKTAVEVGRRLARLADHSQVLVVTHLPQVAVFADQHVVVSKGTDGRVTRSTVTEVAGEQRSRELARMLSGSDESATATAHAAELLDLASKHRETRV
jgi:DNA repair protein RecN (Recombination protein N)